MLGATLDDSFFRSWGWLAGPGRVGRVRAARRARCCGCPAGWTLLGAALSGLPSLVAVLADVHWAGTPLALLLFGALVRAARGARERGRGTGRGR